VTKRPDENDEPASADFEEGMTTAERRRRKRRAGGLRVPSDNVPRRTSDAIVAPTPEDPEVAMSIAYSFSADASGAHPRVVLPPPMAPEMQTTVPGVAPTFASSDSTTRFPTADPDQLDGDDGVDVEVVDIDIDSGEIARGHRGRTEVMPIVAPAAMDTEVGAMAAASNDDSEGFETVTREMAAVDLEALGLSQAAAAMEARDARGGDAAMPGMATSLAALNASGVVLGPIPGGDALSESGAMLAVTDRMAAMASPSAPQAVVEPPRTTLPMPAAPTPAGPAPAPTATPEAGDAVPARQRSARTSGEFTVRPPDASPTSAAFPPDEKSVEIDIGSLEDDAGGTAAVAQGVPSGGSAERVARAETVALVDADVEDAEVLDATPAAFDGSAPDSGPVEADLTDAAEETRDSSETAAVEPPDGASLESGDIVVEASGGATAPAPGDDHVAATASRAAAVVAALGTPSTTNGGGAPPPPPGPRSGPQPAAPPPPPPAAAKPPPAPRRPTPPRAATSDGRKSRRGRAWFEEVFDEDYLRTLPFLTPQATQAEARFVMESLAVQPGAQLLDVGCGYGRHAMELAARGFHVVGLDMSLPLLLRGADEAQRRGLTINFIQGDMRELDFDAQFDGAYCLFSTFGYFDDDTNKKTAANIARALKPGARVIFEVLNRDYIINDLPTRVWWEGDGCVVLEEVEFNYFSSRIQSNRSLVFDDGRQVEQEISVRAYSLHEFGKLLHSGRVPGGRGLGQRAHAVAVLRQRSRVT
jgi:SAM-dependent methyltransferase